MDTKNFLNSLLLVAGMAALLTPLNSAAAQSATIAFPSSNNWKQSADNPQYRILVSGFPHNSVRTRINVDGITRWELDIPMDLTGKGTALARIMWMPLDLANHTVDVYAFYTWNPVGPVQATRTQMGIQSQAEHRYVVLHYLNESGSFQTSYGFNDLFMFDSFGSSADRYYYNHTSTPLPDAIMHQCGTGSIVQYRLLATRNHNVAAGCSQPRSGGTTPRCANYVSVFDNIIANDPNRNNALHVFVTNSLGDWNGTSYNFWNGFYAGGSRRWVAHIDGESQLDSSRVIAHEFMHMSGHPQHVNGTADDNCTATAGTANLMCSVGASGGFLTSTQCTTVHSSGIANIF